MLLTQGTRTTGDTYTVYACIKRALLTLSYGWTLLSCSLFVASFGNYKQFL